MIYSSTPRGSQVIEMNDDFLKSIFRKQQRLEAVPPNEVIANWASTLLRLMFPERASTRMSSVAEIKQAFEVLEEELTEILNATTACRNCNNHLIARSFFAGIPALHRKLHTDIEAIVAGDPAAKSEFEVIRAYPGFFAVCFYRIAHTLLEAEVPLIPRILTEYAHSKTGIDIHPGASIGEYLYIDHGTGIVIGETTVIGKHVKLYQGVTLGALSVEKSMADTKRHPTIEDDVIIYASATILGGETIIGRGSIVGGNVWLTKSIPEKSRVYHRSAVHVVNTKK